MACQCGNFEAVKCLLSHEAIEVDMKDKNNDTPLHEACLHGQMKIVKQLLQKMKEKGIMKINISNKSGLTPLHLACREGHSSTVEILLNHCDSDCSCSITENTCLCKTSIIFICSTIVLLYSLIILPGIHTQSPCSSSILGEGHYCGFLSVSYTHLTLPTIYSV